VAACADRRRRAGRVQRGALCAIALVDSQAGGFRSVAACSVILAAGPFRDTIIRVAGCPRPLPVARIHATGYGRFGAPGQEVAAGSDRCCAAYRAAVRTLPLELIATFGSRDPVDTGPFELAARTDGDANGVEGTGRVVVVLKRIHVPDGVGTVGGRYKVTPAHMGVGHVIKFILNAGGGERGHAVKGLDIARTSHQFRTGKPVEQAHVQHFRGRIVADS